MFVHNTICSSVANVSLRARLNVFMGNLQPWVKKLQFLDTYCKGWWEVGTGRKGAGQL